MKLTEIAFKKGTLKIEMEENRSGGYSVSIRNITDPEDNSYGERVADFRTDEVGIEELIEMLTFARDYNFIQEK